MRIVGISDSHLTTPELPDGDVLFHCGDLTGWGSIQDFEKACHWLQQLRSRYSHVVFVPGNHDIGLDEHKVLTMWDKWEKDPYHHRVPHVPREGPKEILGMLDHAGVTTLVNQSVLINGITIHGMPQTTPFHDWAFMAEEVKIMEHLNKIPSDCQILISHGPPKYILDRCMSGNVGSFAQANYLYQHQQLN